MRTTCEASGFSGEDAGCGRRNSGSGPSSLPSLPSRSLAGEPAGGASRVLRTGRRRLVAATSPAGNGANTPALVTLLVSVAAATAAAVTLAILCSDASGGGVLGGGGAGGHGHTPRLHPVRRLGGHGGEGSRAVGDGAEYSFISAAWQRAQKFRQQGSLRRGGFAPSEGSSLSAAAATAAVAAAAGAEVPTTGEHRQQQQQREEEEVVEEDKFLQGAETNPATTALSEHKGGRGDHDASSIDGRRSLVGEGAPGWPAYAALRANASDPLPHGAAAEGVGTAAEGVGTVWAEKEKEHRGWRRRRANGVDWTGRGGARGARQKRRRGLLGGSTSGGGGGGGGGGETRIGRRRGTVEFRHMEPQERCFVLEGEDSTRCHANIFFFGVSKCGTTSLAHWMFKHPQMRFVTHPDKIDHPGSEAHVMEAAMYETFDAHTYSLTAPEATEETPVVDYTPNYSILADVPYRISQVYGDAARDGTVKYIVLLREPASRTVSSWQFKYAWKWSANRSERRTLEEVFEEGRRRVEALVKCRTEKGLLHSGANVGGLVDLHKCNPLRFMEQNIYLSHVGKSMYFLQLQRWFHLFGRDNVKVVFLEEMTVDPVGTLSGVLGFVGVDLLDEEEGKKGLRSRQEWESIVKVNHNLTGGRKKEILDRQVTPEIMQSMRDFFAPHNAQLQELLGRPLPEKWSLPERR